MDWAVEAKQTNQEDDGNFLAKLPSNESSDLEYLSLTRGKRRGWAISHLMNRKTIVDVIYIIEC